jgi:2-C-methyl-D-erythritol 4-phosphate cytidylyltransferase
MTISAIVPAAGKGARMKGDIPKQFLLLAGKPVLVHTILGLEKSKVTDFYVMVPEGKLDFTKSLLEQEGLQKPCQVLVGGEERQDTVRAGLEALSDDCSLVLIHDGVRPLVRPELADLVIEAADESGAATLASRPTDTIKMQDSITHQMRNLPRDNLVMIQTPQAFKKDLIMDAHKQALADGYTATDDSDLVERMGHQVALVEGDTLNIKITGPEDLILAEAILKRES